jgi:tRNA threonylcarbamoyladenosine biosynthesis protein TsaE
VVLISRSADRTEKIGRIVGKTLCKGSFLALYGGLGGGKTCFTRGVVAEVAPGSAHLVASPTYAIMNMYPGVVPVYHFDFYRLGSDDEITELGFDDFFQGDGVCIAEWSERLERALPVDHLVISFELVDEDSRRIGIKACGADSHIVLTKMTELLKLENFL